MRLPFLIGGKLEFQIYFLLFWERLFANALAAYATAYALILNNYALLSLQISSKFKGDVKIDKQMGGALAVVLILFMVLSTLFNNYLTRRSGKGRTLV